LGGGQLRNYSLLFIISASASFAGFLWVLFFIDEKKDRARFYKRYRTSENASIEPKDDKHDHITHPLKLLFNLENVREIFRTCLKKRDNYVRAQILLLSLAMPCCLIFYIGPSVFMYPFAQKVVQCSYNCCKVARYPPLGVKVLFEFSLLFHFTFYIFIFGEIINIKPMEGFAPL
jgi:hypothetical protein